MFILSNLLLGFAAVLGLVLTIFYWLILIRAVVSWVNPDPYNQFVQFLHKTTEPILIPIRARMPLSWKTSVDISPIIAFLAILFLKIFLVQSIIDIAYRLK